MRTRDREPTDREREDLARDVRDLAEKWARLLSTPGPRPAGREHVDLVRAFGALTEAMESETARCVSRAREAGVGDRRLGAAWGISKQGASKKWSRPSTVGQRATMVARSKPSVGVEDTLFDSPSVDREHAPPEPSEPPPRKATTVAPETRNGTTRPSRRRVRLHKFDREEVERLALVGEREADGGTVWRAMLDGRAVGRVEHAWRGARRTGWQAVPADSMTPVYRAGAPATTRQQALIDLAEHLVRVGLTPPE